MNQRPIRIAVGTDDVNHWHEKLAGALAAKVYQGYPIEYTVIDLGQHDWLQAIAPFDAVIWKPAYLGPRSASHFKEKIYFLEHHLGKVVMPNFASVWHFESKIAQSYILAHYQIPTPPTTVSFNYHDAMGCLRQADMPLVFKRSHGAASRNVWLVREQSAASATIARSFCNQLWEECKQHHPSILRQVLAGLDKCWFWAKVWQKVSGDERLGSIYWQEFVPGNDADLRVATVGDRYAYAFWRRNRPHDFRASGGGGYDYSRSIPTEVLRYCLGLNRALGFDSMAYDILFTETGFVVTEMSCAYPEQGSYNAPGHYTLGNNGELAFEAGHVWPQELWVEWLLSRVRCEAKANEFRPACS